MFPVSTKFLDHVKGSSQRVSVVDIHLAGTGMALHEDIPISEGGISMDRTAQHARTGKITISDPEITEQFKLGIIDSRQVEFHIRSGVLFPDRTSEFVPLGIFRAGDITWKEEVGGTLSIDLVDRSLLLARDAHIGITSYENWSVQLLIQDMVQHATQGLGVSIEFDPTIRSARVPGGTTFDQSRLEAVKQLAKLLLADASFDGQGKFKIVPTPVIYNTTSPSSAVFTIKPGEDGQLISANRGLRIKDVYNYVIVQGASSPDAGFVYGFAFDDNPASPTWIKGPMGIASKVINDSKITDKNQCFAVAQNELAQSTGLAKSLDLKIVPNPALEPGDLMVVQFLDGSKELHVINTIHIPLDLGECTISTLAGPGTF